MDKKTQIFISYDELRYLLANSTEYPCGSPVTNSETEQEQTQDATLKAIIDCIESCKKHVAYEEKIIGTDAFIDSLKQVAKANRMNFKRGSIAFGRLETLINKIGMDSWVWRQEDK